MHWKRWYDCVSCAFLGFFEDEKESSRLWVCQGIKFLLACIRGISEKGAKNQTLCGPDENDAARSTGRLQNGLVRLSIPEDSEDHSGHLSADMANHIHVMQTFGYFLFVIGLKHRITMHCYFSRESACAVKDRICSRNIPSNVEYTPPLSSIPKLLQAASFS